MISVRREENFPRFLSLCNGMRGLAGFGICMFHMWRNSGAKRGGLGVESMELGGVNLPWKVMQVVCGEIKGQAQKRT